MRAWTSHSDLALCMSARLVRRRRRRDKYDLDIVSIEGWVDAEEVDEESVRDDVDVHALAQCDIARSTIVEIAPSLPPNTEELELELEEEDELEETDSGRGVLGGDGGSGGSPR